MKKCMCCMRDHEDGLQACPVCGYSRQQMLHDHELYPDALLPETILGGRFILGRVLSVTDYSVIYMAWDALLLRRVAIREYLPVSIGAREAGSGELTFSDEPTRQLFEEGRAAFEEEAAALGRNQDLLGVFHALRVLRENHTSYIVMEYLEGFTLADLLEERGRLTMQQADHFLGQLALILEAVHRRKLCHGNLSPENIYLDEKGNCTLLDFGNAKVEALRLFGNRVNVLDPHYTAPEMLKRGRRCRVQSDIYSVGAIYYALLTGKALCDKPGRRKRVRTGREDVDQLIMSMTDPVSAKRPVSFGQIRLELGI